MHSKYQKKQYFFEKDTYIEQDELIHVYHKKAEIFKVEYKNLASTYNLMKLRELIDEKGFEDLNYRFSKPNKKIIKFEEELKVEVKDVR